MLQRLAVVLMLVSGCWAQPGQLLQTVPNPSIETYCDTRTVKDVPDDATLLVTVTWKNGDPSGVYFVTDRTGHGLGACWGKGEHLTPMSAAVCDGGSCYQQFYIREIQGGSFTPFIQYRYAQAGLYSIVIHVFAGK